jgi:hypothetical protein
VAIIIRMKLFDRLKALRAFERTHLPFLKTIEDFDLICEIGFHQERGATITLKELFLADIGAVATIQRRLARLRRLGVVKHLRHDGDGRVVELMLSPDVWAVYRRYALLLARR